MSWISFFEITHPYPALPSVKMQNLILKMSFIQNKILFTSNIFEFHSYLSIFAAL